MIDLSTTYVGLKLKNPIIAASSGLSSTISKVGKLVEAGVGAVVLKSLFEEQIKHNVQATLDLGHNIDYPEAEDYVTEYVRQNDVNAYLDLIRESKLRYDVPIIASINCYSAEGWIDFARQIELAGADAIEINIYVLNLDKSSVAKDIESLYFSVLQSISCIVDIPVVIKLGSQFSNLVSLVNRLHMAGAHGVVLFNRFYEPDIDVKTMNMVSSDVFSSPADIRQSIRWVGVISAKVQDIDISASTGIHTGEAIIKQLLAGAQTVQICSAIYKNGTAIIPQMLNELSQWMYQHEFESVEKFRGKLNYAQFSQPQAFERSQFMKYFSNFE